MLRQSTTTCLVLAVCSLLGSDADTPTCPEPSVGNSCPRPDFGATGINMLSNWTELTTGEKDMFACDQGSLPYPAELTACVCDGIWTSAECLQFARDVVVSVRQSSYYGGRRASLAVDRDPPTTCAETDQETVNFWEATLEPGVSVIAVEIDEGTTIMGSIPRDPLPYVFLKTTEGIWANMQCTRTHAIICYARETGNNTLLISVLSHRSLTICNVNIVVAQGDSPSTHQTLGDSPSTHQTLEPGDVAAGMSTVAPTEVTDDRDRSIIMSASQVRAAADQSAPPVNSTTEGYCETYEDKGKKCSFPKDVDMVPWMDISYVPGQVARFSCPNSSIPYPTDAVACQCDGSWGRSGKYCLNSAKVIDATSAKGQGNPSMAVDGKDSTCVGKQSATYWEAKMTTTKKVAAVRVTVDSQKSGTFCPDVTLINGTSVYLLQCSPTLHRYVEGGKTICLCYSADFWQTPPSGIAIFSTKSIDICEVEVFLKGDFGDLRIKNMLKSGSETFRKYSYWIIAVSLLAVLQLDRIGGLSPH